MSLVELIPNISVGRIKLGDNVANYFTYEHTYYKKEVGDKYMEDYYEFLSPPLIAFVNAKNEITTINCNVECIWKDKDLIKLSLSEFKELANAEPDGQEKFYILVSENRGQNQTVYTFENLGLQIWVWRSKIVTVSCTNYNL